MCSPSLSASLHCSRSGPRLSARCCGMSPREAARRCAGKRASGRRIKNSTLGVRRAPNAFACFLADLKQHVRPWNGRRLTGKRTVWRLDLLARRFRSMSSSDRAPFEEAAAAAKRTSAEGRALALVRRRARPIARKSEAAEGTSLAFFAVPRPTTDLAGPADRASAWLRLEVPKHTPCLEPTSPADAVEARHTSLPRAWIWIEAI